ncbi:MAG: hypothetical protein LBD14_03900 [Puniceicoccales bacterium]|jgi:biopolymer transport protein ExbD|nr:hypothetical protein [Puniceicoccales bacterium]
MSSFHSPLGLHARLSPPDRRVDSVPLVTVLLVAVLFTLTGSTFLLPPGLTVAMNKEEGNASATALSLTLPRSGSLAPLPGVRAGAVLTAPVSQTLTAKSDALVIFNGRIFPQTDKALRHALGVEARRLAAEAPQAGEGKTAPATPIILLLKMDASVSMQRFFQLCAYASEAGFSHVQIAAEDGPGNTHPFVAAPR